MLQMYTLQTVCFGTGNDVTNPEHNDTLRQEEQRWEGRGYRRNKVRMKGS